MGLDLAIWTAGIKGRRDPNMGGHARSGWNSPGRNGTRSLVEAARVRRTRKEHPLQLQAREIL